MVRAVAERRSLAPDSFVDRRQVFVGFPPIHFMPLIISQGQPLPKMTQNEARRGAIKDEIKFLSERITLLKAEYNSISLTSILPNEVLVEIFSGVPDPEYLPRDFQGLMLVCRHWHDVLLAAPALWSNVTCGPHLTGREISIQLGRSVPALLTIRIDGVDDLPSLWPMILINADRIKSLELGGRKSLVLDFMHRMRQFDFPFLQSLTFRPNQYGEDLENAAGEMDAHLPLELLEGGMPRLSRLSLSSIDARWASLPPLQSLVLVDGPRSLAFATLFGILQSSPALHTLKLDRMIHAAEPETFHPLELPHLGLLFISDALPQCEVLLANLVFPATTRLHLYPQDLNTGVQIRDILVPVRKHLHARNAPLAPSLALVASRGGIGTHFAVTCYPDRTARFGSDEDSVFVIRSDPTNAPALRQIMIKVLKVLPTGAITFLDATRAHLTLPAWKVALGLLPAIETVRLLAADTGTEFCKAALQIGYPLQTISVFSLDDRDEAEGVAPFIDALTCLLQGYCTSGRPLPCLIVKHIFFRSAKLKVEARRWKGFRPLVGTLDLKNKLGGW